MYFVFFLFHDLVKSIFVSSVRNDSVPFIGNQLPFIMQSSHSTDMETLKIPVDDSYTNPLLDRNNSIFDFNDSLFSDLFFSLRTDKEPSENLDLKINLNPDLNLKSKKEKDIPRPSKFLKGKRRNSNSKKSMLRELLLNEFTIYNSQNSSNIKLKSQKNKLDTKNKMHLGLDEVVGKDHSYARKEINYDV